MDGGDGLARDLPQQPSSVYELRFAAGLTHVDEFFLLVSAAVVAAMLQLVLSLLVTGMQTERQSTAVIPGNFCASIAEVINLLLMGFSD